MSKTFYKFYFTIITYRQYSCLCISTNTAETATNDYPLTLSSESHVF